MAISSAYSLTVPRHNNIELQPRGLFQSPGYTPENKDANHRVTNTLHKLGDIGAILIVGTSLSKLLSPVIPKILKRTVSSKTLDRMQGSRILSQLLDKEKTLKLAFRMASIPGLLMYLYNLEIALNTQQPTKVATTLFSMLQVILGFTMPTSLLQRGFMAVTAGLWSAGERNDIENSLHPERRRELDVREYFSGKAKHQTLHKPVTLSSILQYIGKDLKHVASLQPWKELLQKDKRELLSTQPASYQSALSSQFFLITSGLIWIAWALERKQAPPVKTISAMQKIAQGTTMAGTLLGVLPLWMRAWQMRDQQDSKFMLFGGPIMALGKSLTYSNKYLYLSGFNGIGGSFWSRGLAGNSQKYDTMLDYLKTLQFESSQHPNLTASDLLNYLNRPENLQTLQQNIGKTRSKFILKTLLQAQEAYQQNKTPLAIFLAPMAHSHNDERHIEYNNLTDDEPARQPAR